MGKRINLYNCKNCGNTIVTEDKDKGVTPMFLSCKEFKGCNEMMVSMMYNVPSILKAGYEWYKPDLKDVSNNEKEHVKNGGLLIRKA